MRPWTFNLLLRHFRESQNLRDQSLALPFELNQICKPSGPDVSDAPSPLAPDRTAVGHRAAAAASLADESILDIGQSHIPASHCRMAAPIVSAMDADLANAGLAHLAESDLLFALHPLGSPSPPSSRPGASCRRSLMSDCHRCHPCCIFQTGLYGWGRALWVGCRIETF